MNVQPLPDLGPDERAAFFERDAGVAGARSDAAEIVDRVRDEGDVAVREFCKEFDDVDVGNLDVTDDCERAYEEEIDAETREAIDAAIENVREFHAAQVPEDWRREFAEGRELGRRFRPIDRAGVYVPGGAAAYPSSAIMGVVPAVVAGVEDVVVATPPAADPNPVTLAAIHAAGADEVYSVGGAQAVAAELVAQAEHDEHASVVAVTDDEDLAEAVAAAVDRQASERSREETIRAALDNDASGVLLARSMSEAILFAEEYAAEHLSIQCDDDEAVLDRISNAGSVFLGDHSPVAAGDYAAGTNHVLPTNGGAKVFGGLSVDTFLRSSTVQRLSEAALGDLAPTITTLAEGEGLDAHAESVRTRLDEE